MELFDDLFASSATLKAIFFLIKESNRHEDTKENLPGKSYASALSIIVTENSTRADSIVHKDSAKLLLPVSAYDEQILMGMANRFGHVPRKVRNIKVCRSFITFSLEARIERLLGVCQLRYFVPLMRYPYSSEAHFITKLVEAPDAHFRVTNVKVLGKAKTEPSQ